MAAAEALAKKRASKRAIQHLGRDVSMMFSW
jgi:hypothetical protein